MEPVEETELDALMLEGKQTKAPGKDEITFHSKTNHAAEKKSRHESVVGDNYGDDKKGITQSKTGNKLQETYSTWEINKNESKTKRNVGENTLFANMERNATTTWKTLTSTPRIERQGKPQIVMDTGSEK
eukprot:8651518-Ditylum_brightwellii.AAC.1